MHCSYKLAVAFDLPHVLLENYKIETYFWSENFCSLPDFSLFLYVFFFLFSILLFLHPMLIPLSCKPPLGLVRMKVALSHFDPHSWPTPWFYTPPPCLRPCGVGGLVEGYVCVERVLE